MTATEGWYIGLIILCILLSGLFSTAETALISLQKVRLEHLVHNRVKGAKLVAGLLDRPERLLSTVLMGNEIAQTAATALATALAVAWWPQAGVLIATIGMVIILLIFCDTTPKTVAVHHAERFSLTLGRPIQMISWLLSPFVFVLSWIAGGLTRLVGGTPVPRSLISEEEIRTMISIGHREGTVEEEAAEMLHNVFEMGKRPVSEIMVPRPEVTFIELGITIGEFYRTYSDHPVSRYPVYKENRDNVVGILSIRDIFAAQARGAVDADSTIDGLVRPAHFVPLSKPVDELLTEMRDGNHRLAVVVDEFGGTVGIATFTRLVEEIIGPLGDELAAAAKDYEVIDERTFQIDGSMRVEEANAEMELGLPQGDYETIAGFILHLLRRIPRQGEQIKYRHLKLVITRMRGVKIDEVLVTKERLTGEGAASKEPDAASAG